MKKDIADARQLTGLRKVVWAAIDGTLHPVPYYECGGCLEASRRVVAAIRASRSGGKR